MFEVFQVVGALLNVPLQLSDEFFGVSLVVLQLLNFLALSDQLLLQVLLGGQQILHFLLPLLQFNPLLVEFQIAVRNLPLVVLQRSVDFGNIFLKGVQLGIEGSYLVVEGLLRVLPKCVVLVLKILPTLFQEVELVRGAFRFLLSFDLRNFSLELFFRCEGLDAFFIQV